MLYTFMYNYITYLYKIILKHIIIYYSYKYYIIVII